MIWLLNMPVVLRRLDINLTNEKVLFTQIKNKPAAVCKEIVLKIMD